MVMMLRFVVVARYGVEDAVKGWCLCGVCVPVGVYVWCSVVRVEAG